MIIFRWALTTCHTCVWQIKISLIPHNTCSQIKSDPVCSSLTSCSGGVAHLLWLRLVETHQWNRLIASGNKTLHCPTEPTHFHHYQLLKPPRTLKPNPFNGLCLEFWRLWLVFVFFVLWICGVGTRCYFRLVCMKRVVLRDELVHVNTEVGLGDMADI